MARVRKLLFLIACNGRVRLVRYQPGENCFVTIWGDRERAHAEKDLLHEIVRQAGREIADSHLEGLFIVAPASEIEDLREHMERGLIVVGGVVDDRVNPSDADLADVLTQALRAPSPER